ncbi:hypothetical protein J4526_09725 [Desulfurococcaceae archaeon MEX13E-LK6-19]|nr:hypothetical protein J4526_09725 [Desulfurococcaceae archaeon MEX13E-LK6-19]
MFATCISFHTYRERLDQCYPLGVNNTRHSVNLYRCNDSHEGWCKIAEIIYDPVYRYILWILLIVLVSSGALVVDTMRRLSRVLRIIAYVLVWLVIVAGYLLNTWIIYIDSLQGLFLILCSIAGIAISLYSEGYLRVLFGKIQHLQLIIDMTLLLILMLFTARNLLEFTVLWISIELVAFLLILLERGLENWSVGLKYLVVCVTAGDISLFSWIAITATTIGINKALLTDFQILMNSTINVTNPVLTFLVLVGFLAKLGQIPFHIWLVDTYSEAPSPITAIFSGLMSKMSIYAILRVLSLLDLNNMVYLITLLALGFITTIYASIMASAQTDVKKMIAYSSMTHYGVMTMLLGLLVFDERITGLVYLYVFYHGLLKTHVFLNIASIELLTNTRDIYRLGYLAKVARRLYDKILYTILSLMGLPPTIGFIAKALVIYIALILASQGIPYAFVFLVGVIISSIFSIVYSVKYLGVYVGTYANIPFRPSIMLDSTQYVMEYTLSLLMIIIPLPFLLIIQGDAITYMIYGFYIVTIIAVLAAKMFHKKIVIYETPTWVGGVET